MFCMLRVGSCDFAVKLWNLRKKYRIQPWKKKTKKKRNSFLEQLTYIAPLLKYVDVGVQKKKTVVI